MLGILPEVPPEGPESFGVVWIVPMMSALLTLQEADLQLTDRGLKRTELDVSLVGSAALVGKVVLVRTFADVTSLPVKSWVRLQLNGMGGTNSVMGLWLSQSLRA